MPTMANALTSTICKVSGPVTYPPGAPGPPRGSLVVRAGYVITMDPGTGDLPRADALVRGGVIAAVAPDLPVPPGCHELDAAGMAVAPGLVDTHWHRWNTLLRGMPRHRATSGREAGTQRGSAARWVSEAVSCAGCASVW